MSYYCTIYPIRSLSVKKLKSHLSYCTLCHQKLILTTTMSTTIAMPTAIQGAIQSMCEDAISQAINVLSNKYGFDVEEAQREVNLGKVQIKTASTKATSKSSKNDTSEKTKRGPTGYLLFSKEMRPKVKAELEQDLADGEKLKPQTVVTTLGQKWKDLTDEEKAVWNLKAKSDTNSGDESPACCAPTSPKPTKADKAEKAEKADKAEKGKKVEKPKSKTKDTPESSDAPKKRQSGYLLFGKEMRAEIKAELEAALDEGEKLKPTAVVSEIATRWKALGDDEKNEWNDKAKTPSSSDADSE